jgi:hypothetical protein
MNSAPSFDYLVGEREQLIRHWESERACSVEVDHQLEFGQLEDRQIRGLDPFKNPRGIHTDLTDQ